MGAGQSANGSGSGVTVKTSYYTLLSIEKTATEEEIKKAYRRKALELHPDRNYGKEDDATSKFAEVQAAYEVLSDPQERAWYDSHEGAILRGNDDGDAEESHHYNIKLTTSKDVSHLMGSFYGKKIDYDNVPASFFNILRDFFDKLAEEEARAAKMEGLPIIDYPSFGEKDDTYEDVAKPFYAAWNGFSTEKTYFWEDRHRYSDAPDRRIRRLMEKENKKLRDDAIREFDSSVRNLVAFVRKRDPRYQPNFQTDADRQKALREASAAQAARSRAANAVNLTAEIPEWARTQVADDSEESDEEEIVEEHFECVACHKTFKSEKQFEVHEKSKKHQKSVYQLKRQMQKENEKFNLDDKGQSSGVLTPMSDEEENTEDNSNEVGILSDSIATVELDESRPSAGVAGPVMSEEDIDVSKEKSGAARDGAAESSESGSEEELDDEYAPRSEVTNRLNTLSSLEEHDEEAAANAEPSEPKLGKAAQKRAKKAAKQAAADQEELKHKCANCSAAFSSRTRLFQHITDFGHAAPVAQGAKSSGKKKGKK